jgi:hypothetical protein
MTVNDTHSFRKVFHFKGPSMNAKSATTPLPLAPAGRRYIRIIAGMVLMFALGITAYSIYVAVHEPDPQETVVLGQTQIASGSPAGLRILIRHRASGQPVNGARVELSLASKTAGTIPLGHFQTDASGSLADTINIPELAPGEYQLIVETKSTLGRDRVVKSVQIYHPARILVASDKPLYQPGQTIHIRSLMVNARTEKPFAGQVVTFEVSDPKGNKVFKESRTTSEFGIAATDFVLASELNLGRYELRVLAGASSATRALEVKRYVLPKFNIQIATDKPFYRPGETVSGSVTTKYFFGKPVIGATVKLTAATFQENPVVIGELQGQTDAGGVDKFRFVLPDFFTGMPQKNEQAFLDLTAEVQDSAGHVEEKSLSLSVAQHELEITALPEAGELVPGVENVLYLLTAYPDGRPAVCKVFVGGTAYQSDAQGLCEVKVQPGANNSNLEIQAMDQAGRKRALTYRLESKRGSPAFLLRTDKAIYQAGQTAQINLWVPEQQSTVFIDVIKEGQTVLTRSVPVNNHKAVFDLPLGHLRKPGIVRKTWTKPSHIFGLIRTNSRRPTNRRWPPMLFWPVTVMMPLAATL